MEIPPEIEAEISRQEQALTEDLRSSLGRDDITVELDRSEILLIPEKLEPQDFWEDFSPGNPFFEETVELVQKPIRKWPDDFRGFGSNVQPKKRRKS